MAADSQFGVALTTLWHDVSSTGAPAGFLAGSPRSDIAKAAAATVEQLRSGRALGLALVAPDRSLVGFGKLTPGRGVDAHTGELSELMIAPLQQGNGLGTRLLTELIDRARALGLQQLRLAVRDGHRLEDFYRRFGATEYGRLPEWINLTDPADAGASAPRLVDLLLLRIDLRS
ncbi:GNAT family N-acetyltransferase [Nakamurella aerolata]|uniref:GNAT family N-acetyltransferase n=1 Tax=Nakamurella aerolata TaxID=1656892 RepID=A0A849AAE8_9ACTN|nr:GNAT family N-acetyltransferase [Nakamurella aerolata]NNG36566.1 GNAT family N-acetyltransferase [Nakamurella aerolata]